MNISRPISWFKGLSEVRGFQLFQVLRFGMIFTGGIILAKSSLSIGDVGIFETFLFLSTAVSFFWVSGLMNVLLSRYPAKHTDERGKELFGSAVNLYSVNLLLIITGWAAGPYLRGILPQEILPYYRHLLIYIFLNNPTYLIEHIFLLNNRPLRLAGYGIFQFTAHLAAIGTAIFMQSGLVGIFTNLILVALFKNFLLISLLKVYGKPFKGMVQPLEQLINAVPLMGGLLLAGSAEYIDGYLVSSHFGNDAFAIFRYGAREFPLSLLLANSLSAAFVPRLAASGSDGKSLESLKSESRGLMHLLFPVAIIFILISHWMYPVLFRPQFAQSAGIFNIYLLLVASRMLFPQAIVYGHNKSRVVFMIALAELAINIAASLTMMGFFGINGVAYGTLIAFLAEKTFLILYCKYKLGIPPSSFIPLRTWSFYTLSLALVYLVVTAMSL